MVFYEVRHFLKEFGENPHTYQQAYFEKEENAMWKAEEIAFLKQLTRREDEDLDGCLAVWNKREVFEDNGDERWREEVYVVMMETDD